MCGSTLAELHEQDLLAMGVEKLGHRKLIMQGIRVLFSAGAELEPELPGAPVDVERPAPALVGAASGESTQEESGTV